MLLSVLTNAATALTADFAMPTSQVSVDAAVNTQNVVANQNMAENTGNAQQTLVDSRWAPAAIVAPPNSFASAFTAAPIPAATSGWGAQQPTEATQPGPVNNTWGSASSASYQVPATSATSGWSAPVQQAVPASQPGVAIMAIAGTRRAIVDGPKLNLLLLQISYLLPRMLASDHIQSKLIRPTQVVGVQLLLRLPRHLHVLLAMLGFHQMWR